MEVFTQVSLQKGKLKLQVNLKLKSYYFNILEREISIDKRDKHACK